MKITARIRKFLAIALLLAFSIGITPKIYFHDLLSKHTDSSCTDSQPGQIKLTAYKFNCGLVNIEAISPFLSTEKNDSKALRSFASDYAQALAKNWLQIQPDHKQYRGPPQTV